jgi:transcriptional regulator with XRE-family HTH domain
MNKIVKKYEKPVKKEVKPAKKVLKDVDKSDSTDGCTIFFNRYVEACHKRAVAPSAVALAIGENHSAANRWKNGVIPSGSVLLKLSEYLGVSIDFLMGNDLHVYTPEERDLLKIFRSIQASQKYALLSIANKLMEQDNCLDVVVKKETNTEVKHNYI